MTNIAGVGLGRVLDVVTVGDAKGISVVNANALSFVCYSPNSDGVFTLTISKTFGSGYTQPSGFNPFTYYYTQTAADGTSAWSKATQAASNAITVSGSVTNIVIPFFTTQMPDGYKYVKLTGATDASRTVTVVLHDLAVRRDPTNLAILGA